jgi:DNA-binding LytR/AlgR family response regulator
MHIRVAVCDDEQELCSQLEKILVRIFREYSMTYEIDVYNHAENLYLEMQRTIYELVFLDIEFPKMNGIELGRMIRDELKNETTQIAYVSAKKDYALELFEFRPINFLVKPLDYERVKKVVDKYLLISEKNNQIFTYKKGKEFYKMNLSEVKYFINDNRKVRIITVSGEDEFYDSMDNIYSQLKDKYFLFIHKSYIVNYKYVKMITYEQVTMTDNNIFSISQSRRKAIREKYLDLKRGIN